MNMEGFAVNMQFLWKLDKSSGAEKNRSGWNWCAAHIGPRGEDGPAW